MNEGNAVLVIEDELTLAKNIVAYLRRAGYDAEHVGDAEQGLARLESFRPDVIVLDYNLPGMNGLAALREIRAIDAHVRVIMLTGHGNVRTAVDAMKATAFDYLTKPVMLAELKALIAKAIGDERRDEAMAHAQRAIGGNGLDAILGVSPAIVALKETIRTLVSGERSTAGTPPPVLVTGETGTGKELIARAVHGEGARASRPFVEINCGSIPGNLLESELFGHERGAFTDARERKIGLIEAADGGTLFLDEIGDLELGLQVKLLRVLEDRVIRRLGSVRDRAVDVRVVSATNRPLESLVASGKFRSDLLFRLRIVSLHAPPLRERGDDALLLARHFLDRFSAVYGRRGMTLTPDAEESIRVHAWPGNVRELRNVVEQAVLLAPQPAITAEFLRILPAAPAPTGAGTRSGAARTLEDVEREMLGDALRRTHWNVSRAAQALGVSRDTLRYRMVKFGLRRPGFEEAEAGDDDAQNA
jgi:DNA-binding NtrC family response regulator